LTSFTWEAKKCAICGSYNIYEKPASLFIFREPDLDLRMFVLGRDHFLRTLVEVCPSCGYCAIDSSKKIGKAEKLVRSDHYKRQFNNPNFPELANAFLCSAMIQESVNDYAKAGLSCIYAAWACDDEGFETAARDCRKKAIVLLQKARKNKQRFLDKGSEEEELLIIDLLRRSGQFERALELCDKTSKKNPKKRVLDILKFQKQLIEKSDTKCHNLSEVFEREDDTH